VAPGSTVLDVAAGAGRHTQLFLERGHPVVAVDRDTSRLAPHPRLEVVRADLEDGSPWPLGDRTFGGIVVTNYLHRPLLPLLLDRLAPGGVLVYETFARGQEQFGKPSNPDFLLDREELLRAVASRATVVAFEDVALPDRVVQRIAARRT
jgi:SAM-dependent methyltransferase